MLARTLVLSSFFLLLGRTINATPVPHPTSDSVSIEGRWDITLTMNGKDAPSWLEVRHSGNHTLVGDWVSTGGSARPISEVHYQGGKLHFSIPPQWESGSGNLVVEGRYRVKDCKAPLHFRMEKNLTGPAFEPQN